MFEDWEKDLRTISITCDLPGCSQMIPFAGRTEKEALDHAEAAGWSFADRDRRRTPSPWPDLCPEHAELGRKA